tara:strand:- start:337 stop:855 length:519 start_codon:yes stop_codon:yes gene_type:complete
MKNLERYLKSFGKRVIAGAKNNLKAIDSDMGSKIKVSVKRDSKGGYDVTFFAPQHAEGLDKGINGKKFKRYYKDYLGRRRKTPGKGYTNKMPPSIVFEKWMKKKGIKGRNKKTGRFQKRSVSAFAMAKHMQIKGRKGLEFFQKPLALEYKKLNKGIANSIKKDFAKLITSTK